MATYKAEHLREMIRSVVREEMRGVVSGVIAEVLSEKFLKQLAESAVASRPRGVSNLPIQGDDEYEEETPQVLSNTILGVGQKHPMFHKDSSKTKVRQYESDESEVNESAQRNQMLSLFFEGTKPLEREEDIEVMPGEVPIPMEKPKVKALTETWVAMAQGIDNKVAEKRAALQKDPEAEAARIKKMREALDAKVVA